MEDVTDGVDSTQIAVVTGANSGIGLAAATELAQRGWQAVLIGRDKDRLYAALEQVREHATGPDPAAHQCDFAVLDEVRELAGVLRQAYPHIDLLANNAGGAFTKRMTTVDGFELTIQVNHLAHFLLTHLLRDRLTGGRIVNTSSAAHAQGAIDPDNLSSEGSAYRTFTVYGSAKQANILFAAEAARRWPEVVSASFHPGVVRTRFGRDSRVMSAFYRLTPGLRTPEKGADTLVWLGTTDAREITPGGYYMDRQLRQPSSKLANPALGGRLWNASRAAVGL